MRLRKDIGLTAILAFGCTLAIHAADWLTWRADYQLSGWQKHENILRAGNVGGLRLIWKLALDSGAISTPAILGHWVTNRGTKELFFAVSGTNNVYAVDGDLGRLFWRRHLEEATTADPIAPILAPGPDNVDEDEDVRQAIRPLFVTGAEGRRHRLHPTTGLELTEGTAPSVANRPAASAAWESGWIFTASTANVVGSRDGKRVWVSPVMIAPAPPVIANGVVYVLSKGSKTAHATLYAFDAKTGTQLYFSRDLITSFATSSGLAVANGHIAFGTQDGVLYCFGFPVDL